MSYGRTEIPVVVINHVKVLDGQDITGERLEEEIGLAEAGAYAGMSKQRGNRIAVRIRVPRDTLLIFPWDYDRAFPLSARESYRNDRGRSQYCRLPVKRKALCSHLRCRSHDYVSFSSQQVFCLQDSGSPQVPGSARRSMQSPAFSRSVLDSSR